MRAAGSSAASLSVRVELQSVIDQRIVSADALVDSGATSIGYVDKAFVARTGLSTTPLKRAIPVYNVDGSRNEEGSIREVVHVVLGYKGHSERVLLAVTDLGNQDIILGHGWLKYHNPEIDWKAGELKLNQCPSQCGTCQQEARNDLRNLKLKHAAAARERQDQACQHKDCCRSSEPRVVELEEETDDDDCTPADTFGCDSDDEFPDM